MTIVEPSKYQIMPSLLTSMYANALDGISNAIKWKNGLRHGALCNITILAYFSDSQAWLIAGKIFDFQWAQFTENSAGLQTKKFSSRYL